jgi:hypothetical protein
MNIFYTNKDPEICAIEHCDKHNIKMILESCQLLSTAHRVLDGKEYIDASSGRKIRRWKLDNSYDGILYKATHINHPSAIWARKSYDNYIWLHSLVIELCKEYTYRYGKVHKCEQIELVDKLSYAPFNIPVSVFTEPTPAMPPEYIVKGDSIKSYQKYIREGKIHLHNWKNRPTPSFITL